MHRFISCGVALAVLFTVADARAQGYGTLEGQYLLDGDIPAVKVIVAKGGKVKDPQVCAAKDLLDNTLLVDAKSKGIANIAIFMKKKPKKIHPDLKASKEKKVVFDQENCRFIPHMLLLRTDQQVIVKSNDPVNHNTHTYPFLNEEMNFTVRPKDRVGVPIQYELPEFIPTKVVCDLHPHMKAYWVIVDHPYAAVTDKDGKFKIEKIPEGDYTFQVWHERCGFINKKLDVSIFADDTEDLGKVKVDVKTMESK